MKAKSILIVFLFLFVSFSLEINANGVKAGQVFSLKVMDLEQTSYDYIFRLKQKSIYHKVNLDCQSFFNGLHFLSKEEKIMDKIILDNHECEQLFLMIEKKEEEFLCFNVNLEEDILTLDQSGSNCL